MRGLNLSSFKKIAEDKTSATMKHEDGHTLRIAKSALPAIQRKQLEKLPLYKEDGGDIPNPQPSQNQDNSDVGPDKTDIASNNVSSQPMPTPSPTPNQDAQDSVTAAPETDQSIPNAGAPVGPQATPQSQSSGVDINSLYKKGQNAIQEQANVEKQLSQANVPIEQSDLDARQNLMDAFKKNTEDFQNQQKLFMQDYANNHIDPNHYIENMGSGQKVATAIGLFLGGWSSAYTHQGNPAMDFLNKQIDRDIGAQQDRLGQQKTLLEANQNLYHDNVMAMNATRMQMNDIYSHQMQLAASKLGTPAAQAKADMATSQWGLQNAGLLQQNAIRAAALHDIGANGGQGVDPMTLSAAGLMPQEEAVKEQKELDSQKNAIASTKNLFQQMNKEQTTSNLLNPESSRRVSALNAQLVNTVMEASPSKRLTRESIEQEIKPFEILTTDDAKTRQSKQDGVLNLIGKTGAGTTPYLQRFAPKSLPQYPFQQTSQTPQYKVGDVVYIRGQKVQIINQAGDYIPIKS